MADVMQKAINANNIKYGTITVKVHGGNKANAFDYDDVPALINPDGSSATYWENKLQGRFDDPTYYDA